MRPDPKVDLRRARELLAELLARAKVWIPDWQPESAGVERDFGQALLKVAARLGSEVTERLDRVPGKAALGLLDWLGITPGAGRAARMPVVFRMAEGTGEPVFAPRPVRIQYNTGDTPTVFETEQDVQLAPSPIKQMVAVDPAADAFYYPPGQVLSLDPPTSGPDEWIVNLLAPNEKGEYSKIQFSPALGLEAGTFLKINEHEYRVEEKPQGDIATVEPSIVKPANDSKDPLIASKLSRFEPFGDVARNDNRQEHLLYIGDDETLNLTAHATITLSGAQALPEDLEWEYWGKFDDGDPDWQKLDEPKRNGADLQLEFPKSTTAQEPDANQARRCSIEEKEINGRKSRWIRARRKPGDRPFVRFSSLRLKINSTSVHPCDLAKTNAEGLANPPKLEGVANNTALVLNEKFYPLGKIPRQFDSFYLACPEVFSKKDAQATIYFDVADSTLGRLAVIPMPKKPDSYRVYGVSKDGALHRYTFTPTSESTAVHMAINTPRPSDKLKSGASADDGGQPVLRDLQPSFAPVVKANGLNPEVYVAAGRDIWIWTESLAVDAPDGEWIFFKTIPDDNDTKPPNPPISALTILGPNRQLPSGGVAQLFPPNRPEACSLVVLAGNSLYSWQGSEWSQPIAPDKGPWIKVAPIYGASTRSALSGKFVALNDKGSLYLLLLQHDWEALEVNVGSEGKPVASNEVTTPLAVYTAKTGKYLVAWGKQAVENEGLKQVKAVEFEVSIENTNITNLFAKQHFFDNATILGTGFDFSVDPSSKIQILLALVPPNDAQRVAWWVPQEADLKPIYSEPYLAGGAFADAPTWVDSHIVVPGQGLDLMTAEEFQTVELDEARLFDGIVASSQAPDKDDIPSRTLKKYDIIKLEKMNFGAKVMEEPVQVTDGSVVKFVLLGDFKWREYKDVSALNDASGEVYHHLLGSYSSKDYGIVNPNVLKFYKGIPAEIKNGLFLSVPCGDGHSLHKIESTYQDIQGYCVKIEQELDKACDLQELSLYELDKDNEWKFSVLPVLKLNDLENKTTLIQNFSIVYFLDEIASPKSQELKYDNIDERLADANKAVLAVLAKPWNKPPAASDGKFKILVQPGQASWKRVIGATCANPDLSWEYWNGTGWWSLKDEFKHKDFQDNTKNLKTSGCVRFNVPTDLEPTDVVLGKKSYWIRARLVGGDYGRETFQVTRTPIPPKSGDETQKSGDETQSVVVNTDNIRAPCVLRMGVSYSICPATPKYLLTLDSGSWLDQSDANRTGGATVDAFVPIAKRLRQLSGSPLASAGGEASSCDCGQLGAAAVSRTTATSLQPRPSGEARNAAPPKVLSKTPADKATGVADDSAVTVRFNQAMDPATIESSTFELRDADNAKVSATVSYDAASLTAALKPNEALGKAATYTAILKAAKNLSGKALAVDVTWTFTTATPDSRAIYLVFDKKMQGGPISLLFLLDDQDHGAAAPLVVEALRDNRFEKAWAVDDDTQALGESGVVTLFLDAPPTEAELFGVPGFWLRLRPRDSSLSALWSPSIRGAYVNATWAVAVETQKFEILGASDGSPGQQFKLTHFPVLGEGLELRVREPLGEEELEELKGKKKALFKDKEETVDRVVENPDGLPGDWVLWERVEDTGDCGPNDRVYALDFKTGEVRFGDGEHGAIPPIGRDAVVAFNYRHGGEEKANQVMPFAPLNLVTPIRNVEAAITPDQAAGGADPENAAMVRRFAAAKLRHRDRAITLQDLEDLALAFSPHVAQARAFSAARGVRLVVVIQGPNPDPSQASRRELKRFLLERASPALARQGAFEVTKAETVEFRLRIALRLASLEAAGSVGKGVKNAVKEFFDAATGGYDKLGWRLGAQPTIDDIAAQLVSIDGIDSIDAIRFSADGTATETDRLAVKPDQLARLAPDGVNIQFSTATVTA